MMSSKTLNIPTYNWYYCKQSGWSFQAGKPSLEEFNFTRKKVIKLLGKHRFKVIGEYTLHVIYGKWKITHHNKPLISYLSKIKNIEYQFNKLDGIVLKTISIDRKSVV